MPAVTNIPQSKISRNPFGRLSEFSVKCQLSLEDIICYYANRSSPVSDVVSGGEGRKKIWGFQATRVKIFSDGITKN